MTNLDASSSWVASKSGFGNCFETWYTSEVDSNAGVIVVADADGVLNLGEDLTIEFWMNPSEAPANFGTIGKKYTGGPWSVGLTSSMNIIFGWYAGGWESATDTGIAISTNDLTHVAVVVDRSSASGTQTVYFFINGSLSNSKVGPKGGGAGTENVYLLNVDTGGDTYLYRGKLDELRISNAIRDYGNLVPEIPGLEPFVSDYYTRALWHFDGSAGQSTFYDSGPYGNHGTIATGINPQLDPNESWASSMNDTFGNCLESWNNSPSDINYGGIEVTQSSSGPTSVSTTQSVYFPSGSEEPYEPSDFTWEFLICPYTTAGTKYIMNKYTGGDYGISMTDGIFGAYWYAPGGWASVGYPANHSARVPAHRWTHVAIVAERTLDLSIDTWTFYYNGVEVYQTGTDRKSGGPNTYSLWIGSAYNNDAGVLNRLFLGKLDEVRISNICRYGDQVPPDPPAERAPSKWYKPYTGVEDTYTIVLLDFDDTSGNITYDSAPAGGNNNGRLSASADFTGRSFTEVPKPAFNRSLSFNGTDGDSVTINDTDALDMRFRMTMECWVYPTGMGGGWTRPIISKPYAYGLTWAYDRLLGWTSNGTEALGYNHNRGYTTTADRLFMGKWNHIAMTYALDWEGDTANATGVLGNRVRLFIDGEEMVGSDLTTAQTHYGDIPIFPSSAPIMIGWTMGGTYPTFEGYMDDLRISSDARNIGGVAPLTINWIKRVGNDAMLEFASAPRKVYVIQSSVNLNPWSDFGGATGDYGVTEYTDAGAISGGAKKFYRVKNFEAVSMGYAQIGTPSITVDGLLTDWSSGELIATRDNFHDLGGDPMPYMQSNVYGGYDASNFYFAFDFDEVSTGDVLELMFTHVATTDTSMSDQIRFDKGSPNQFSFAVFDTDDSSIHLRWDTGEGDTYTDVDFIADGGAFTDVKVGGKWMVEIKVPFSWIGPGYTFPASTQRPVQFN